MFLFSLVSHLNMASDLKNHARYEASLTNTTVKTASWFNPTLTPSEQQSDRHLLIFYVCARYEAAILRF